MVFTLTFVNIDANEIMIDEMLKLNMYLFLNFQINILNKTYARYYLKIVLLNQFFCRFHRGLDNKVTVYPLSLEDDATQRKKPVGTHTSYTACCTFLPYSDYQVCKYLSVIRFNIVGLHGEKINVFVWLQILALEW